MQSLVYSHLDGLVIDQAKIDQRSQDEDLLCDHRVFRVGFQRVVSHQRHQLESEVRLVDALCDRELLEPVEDMWKKERAAENEEGQREGRRRRVTVGR